MSHSQYPVSLDAPPLAAEPAASPHAPALSFDIEAYRKFVSDAGLTDAQEDELLKVLWEVVVACVDLGFDVHPVQQAMATKTLDADSDAVVGSSNISKNNKIEVTSATVGGA